MEKIKRTTINDEDIATYFSDRGLILNQNLAFGDFGAGTGNAVWKIEGQLRRRKPSESGNDEREIKLAYWSGYVLSPAINQSDESDAISADCDYLYTAIAPGWLMNSYRVFKKGLKTNTGETPMEKSPQEYNILLLPKLKFTKDAFKEDEFSNPQDDNGLDAFLKAYDFGIGMGVQAP